MPTPIHSKIINKVARKILKENGIERKGQSRTWLDDQYWFTTVIEFQPFKDRQGTCLNVGVNFHWYEKNISHLILEIESLNLLTLRMSNNLNLK